MAGNLRLLVLLDTSTIYALLDKHDQDHERARTLFAKLENAEVRCPLSTAQELHRLLLQRKPKQPLQALEAVRLVVAVYPLSLGTEADAVAALATLERYPDQGISLADAMLATMAKRERAKVLTFDWHFGLLGAEVYQ